MGDPTGLASWALGKSLDTVIEYVKESRKYYDHCDDLDQLLQRIKPLLSQGISKSSTSKSAAGDADLPSSELSPVDNWLMDLNLELEKASATLEKALASNPSSHDIFKKKKYSDRIRDITERIRKVKNDGEGLATLVEVREVHRRMEGLTRSSVGVEAATKEVRSSEDLFLLQLKNLRRRSAHDPRCQVKLEVADTHTQGFHVPGALVETSELENSQQAMAKWGRMLKITRGGFEVNNATKLRLTIQVDFADDWYFYIVFVDISEGSHPELVFPEEAMNSNSLNRMRKRVFPDLSNYEDDPPNVKLIRSRTSPTDACEQESLYLLIVRNRLHTDDPTREITIQDVQSHLQSLPDSDIIVKNWDFDIRPPQF